MNLTFLRQRSNAKQGDATGWISVRRMPLLIALSVVLAAGCGCAPPPLEKRFTDILQEYPATEEPLKIPGLASALSSRPMPNAGNGSIVIMVHPGYSLFFRSRERNLHSEAKYDLLKLQMDSEAESIRRIARSGQPLILVIPGNYQRDSIAPLSYTSFLNSLVKGSTSVYTLFSESASSGTLATDTMVTLFRYLQSMKADRVLIGGGYIGRCEREFAAQLMTYIDNIEFVVVPELSSVSPDDITDKEARAMLDGLQQNDFTLIRQFIERKHQRLQVPFPGDAPAL